MGAHAEDLRFVEEVHGHVHEVFETGGCSVFTGLHGEANSFDLKFCGREENVKMVEIGETGCVDEDYALVFE